MAVSPAAAAAAISVGLLSAFCPGPGEISVDIFISSTGNPPNWPRRVVQFLT